MILIKPRSLITNEMDFSGAYKYFFLTLQLQTACLFREILAASIPTLYQQVRIDVMTSVGAVNMTIPGTVTNTDPGASGVPDEGIVGALYGSRPTLDGCSSPALPSNHSVFYSLLDTTYVALILLQRNRCNFAQAVEEAESRGYSAILVYESSYSNLPLPVISHGTRNLSIPIIYIGFQYGQLLSRRFQLFTMAYVVITASASNASINYALTGAGVTSTPSSDVANVLLGFIPAVSYVCIVLSVILIIIARRFIHCSLFVVYKMAMHHNPKVAPIPTSRSNSKTEVSSVSRCTICLEEFKPTELIHAILPCQHVFHQHCIDQWLRKGKLVCPLCRRKITLKKIIRHVFLNHEAHHKGHIFVIPFMCRPSAVSDSTVHIHDPSPA